MHKKETPFHIERNGITEIVRFESFNSFLNEVLYLNGFFYEKFKTGFVYRGHSSDEYELIPKVLRESEEEYYHKLYPRSISNKYEYGFIRFEKWLLHNFKVIANRNRLYVPDLEINLEKLKNEDKDFTEDELSEYWIDGSSIKSAMLAQHYGIHTRLLDWTYDIYVAIYFAIIDHLRKQTDSKNIAIWCIDRNLLNEYTTKRTHLIRPLISNFYLISGSNYRIPNMAVQKGLFSLWQIKVNRSFGTQIDRTPLNDQLSIKIDQLKMEGIDHTQGNPIFYKIVLPSSCYLELYEFINNVGYNTSSMFPYYNHIKESIDDIAMLEWERYNRKNSK